MIGIPAQLWPVIPAKSQPVIPAQAGARHPRAATACHPREGGDRSCFLLLKRDSRLRGNDEQTFAGMRVSGNDGFACEFLLKLKEKLYGEED